MRSGSYDEKILGDKNFNMDYERGNLLKSHNVKVKILILALPYCIPYHTWCRNFLVLYFRLWRFKDLRCTRATYEWNIILVAWNKKPAIIYEAF